ncbi:D-alanine--D-alanine ligase [Bradyrhizobium sp. CW4]|uniref:D-alanine--D-alanine ligase family protein n=1 Tax=Bradyrhizobium sp. CW4 TaxID=2782687 RepID=UPI001FFC1D6E|nr:D-alanine--D-alanine ligase family protein [Bradyrhizobium sp. CW4]MCK1417281.1 D-alanine--D-alanine ligase [Bradyrhizobium sp. CW4]
MTILNVALIFGGQSAEHDASVMSARSIYETLDRERYSPILVGVAQDGKWWLLENTKEFPSHVGSSGAQIVFLAGEGGKALVHGCSENDKICHVDVVFPIIWNGFLQGVLETARVPFLGSRMPAPAITRHKHITKRILRDAGLPIARSLDLTSREEIKFQIAQEALSSHSLFVKPASLHSSIGVSKVTCESEFEAAVDLALTYDSRVLVEEYVQARELECAVLQDAERPSELLCSWPCEIIPTGQNAFFSYRAKSEGKGVIFRMKADVDESVADRMRALSCKAFKVIGCEVLARVDFFMRPNGELLINEVGSAPAFGPSSIFSRMIEESGIRYDVLVQRLIEDAIKRSERARPEL